MLCVMFFAREMKSAKGVQILDDAVCVSLYANALEKENPPVYTQL